MIRQILLILICCLPQFVFADTNINEAVQQLDQELLRSKHYDQAKEKSIADLCKKLADARDAKGKLLATRAIYDAYSSYKYDSAFVYAQREISIARAIGDPSDIVMATCDKIYCLFSAGLYNEASDEIARLNTNGISREAKKRYLIVNWRLNADLADYVHTQPYTRIYVEKAHVLCDSVLKYIDKHSWEYPYMETLQLMKDGKHQQCMPILERLAKTNGIGLHEKAIIYSNIALAYKYSGHDKDALKYFVLSATCDIESSTKETTSAREAGSVLYAMGDYTHAISYVQKALDDANFYGARQRMIEINNILPIIQRDRYESVARQRNTMIVAISVVSILFIFLCITIFFLRRKMIELQTARHTIEERNRQLEENNRKLQEADRIKTEYIGRSFTLNADYINMMEKLYRTLDHKIMARQYTDLSRSLQESKLNAQRKSMYAGFDDAFLAIFPHFIEKYNSLFAPENRKEPDNGQKLTTEMRIFALIRLGVTDADRIASFLHYSVNTINTYKTRVKNKSLVTNEEFEDKIMAIDA